MTHQRPSERLRVDVPTLEPDPAFLGMLAHLSAASQTTTPRTTRSAGFRMVLATGSVAVIAAATWAAGIPTGGGDPHSPADSPARIGPSGTPSPGDVGTPHSDVPTPPGSPLSPGLPGNSVSSSPDHATDPGRAGRGKKRGSKGLPDQAQGDSQGKPPASPGKDKDRKDDRGKPAGQDRDPGAASEPGTGKTDGSIADTVDNTLKGIPEGPAGVEVDDGRGGGRNRPTH